MAREIEIEISPEGIVRGDISGFGGTRCREIAGILSEIVGQEVGFLTVQNFMRVFKSKTGVPPSEYRSTLPRKS